MSRPTKKDIQAAVEKLKGKSTEAGGVEHKPGKLTPKHSSQRIRKQGV